MKRLVVVQSPSRIERLCLVLVLNRMRDRERRNRRYEFSVFRGCLTGLRLEKRP